jgi:hypothetical protein
MPLFFVLAGFFAALLVEKRGMLGTFKDRAARVLAPLVVGSVTLLPLDAALLVALIVAVASVSWRSFPIRGGWTS